MKQEIISTTQAMKDSTLNGLRQLAGAYNPSVFMHKGLAMHAAGEGFTDGAVWRQFDIDASVAARAMYAQGYADALNDMIVLDKKFATDRTAKSDGRVDAAVEPVATAAAAPTSPGAAADARCTADHAGGDDCSATCAKPRTIEVIDDGKGIAVLAHAGSSPLLRAMVQAAVSDYCGLSKHARQIGEALGHALAKE